MKLAIIAGGKGTRLGLKDIPKPMVEIAGKPLLEYQIELAKKYDINDIYILSGHLSEVIINYFGNGEAFGVSITHIVEERPLGTGGAVKQLQKIITDRFLVFYGDTILDIDIDELLRFDNIEDSIATILVHPNDHPYDSDLLDVDDKDHVISFSPKPHSDFAYKKNLVNAALYILSPEVFNYIPDDRPSDFGKDIFPHLLSHKNKIRAYRSAEYIKDMGTPERFEKTKHDLISGKVSRLNRTNKRKAVFLDRDGVINKEVVDLRNAEQFELIDESALAIKKINKSEYLSIVITNQPGIAKGFFTYETLSTIHNKMDTLLGKEGAYIDNLYFCPHHPEKGFAGEIPDLKIDCECRKPKPGLIYVAADKHNIDLKNSFFIGDRYADIMAGKNAGLRTVLVKTGYAGSDKEKYSIEPDYTFKNLNEAINFIIEEL
jgi:histidinol-phosphate phosphatase family protein